MHRIMRAVPYFLFGLLFLVLSAIIIHKGIQSAIKNYGSTVRVVAVRDVPVPKDYKDKYAVSVDVQYTALVQDTKDPDPDVKGIIVTGNKKEKLPKIGSVFQIDYNRDGKLEKVKDRPYHVYALICIVLGSIFAHYGCRKIELY